MGVPSGFSRNHIALHGTVSRNHILDNTGKDVADMRLSVCGRRSVIEGIGLAFLAVFHTFTENVILFPEFFYFFFSLYKIKICTDFFVHFTAPYGIYYPILRISLKLGPSEPEKHTKKGKAHKIPMVFYSFHP